MPVGTTDASSTNQGATLDATIADAIADVNSGTLEDGSVQDEAQNATGANPDVLNETRSDPVNDADAGQTTQPVVQAPLIDDDPLAGSEPVTITVDGQSRTIEGFYRIPGQGIIIDEEKVPAFQLMASRAEGLERQNRELYQRTQEYERLSEWKTKGPDGTDTTLTGRQALEARDVELAKTKAWSQVLEESLINPALFASLVTVNEQGQIIPNVEQLRYLATRAQLASRDAADVARSRFSTTYQATTQAQHQAQLQEQAPTLLWQTADQVWGKEFPQLTPDDKTFLSSQVLRYMRPATPAEVQAGQFKPGESVLDPSFYTVMQDRAALRAQMSATTTATISATKFNQGQQNGRKPAPVRPVTPTPVTPTSTTPAKRGQEVWDDVLQNALREVTV